MDELDPTEEARDRRRDRDADAERREPMRSGTGKVFEQTLDARARPAQEPPARGRRRTG